MNERGIQQQREAGVSANHIVELTAMVAAMKTAVCCDDLLHFALSKPALQPEVRAVGEWEVKRPDANKTINDRTRSKDQTTPQRPRRRAPAPEMRQRQGLYWNARSRPSCARQSRAQYRGDEAPRSHHVAGHGPESHRRGSARCRAKSVSAELRSRLAGDREDSGRAQALSSWRGGAWAKTSAPNRRAKCNDQAVPPKVGTSA